MLIRLTFLSTLLCFTSIAYSQSSLIKCTKFKQIQRENGEWEDWPSSWNTYEADVNFVITDMKDSDYQLQMFIDGVEEANFLISYDEEVSEMKRKDWDEEYVNCYKDEEDNYLYLMNVSLKSLLENPKDWNSSDAVMYLWVFSDDYAVIVK